MKKTFSLTHPKIKVARLADAARHDVKKYLKRERKKDLPAGADYWAFECRFGPSEEEATAIHVSDIGKHIDEAEKARLESFFLEVLAKPGHRTTTP